MLHLPMAMRRAMEDGLNAPPAPREGVERSQ